MEYRADLHIHSPYSRATSKESSLHGLAAWASMKGIQVVATGDAVHPGWLRNIAEELVPAEAGFFQLKHPGFSSPITGSAPVSRSVRFVLTTEISCIYKRHGAVRKVHNLVYFSGLDAARCFSDRLAAIGNIASDGRPILGLDSRDLLEMLLETDPEGFLVPAHIWTPWFSLFGSRSGFDHIEECFGDLTPHVFALETGLSSDPTMNRMVSALDRFAFISNSDCHSPSNIGREANLFATGFDFHSMRDAIRANSSDVFQGTIEFFPEEGKYHLDGHRECGVCFEPEETRRHQGRCPVCKRPVTVGVLHRVLELADRKEPLMRADAPAVFSLLPLVEIIAELLGVGATSKKVGQQYRRLLGRFGSELDLLLNTPPDELASDSPLLAEAVQRVRTGDVTRHGGYDGEYGTIKLFHPGELSAGEEVFPGVRRKG